MEYIPFIFVLLQPIYRYVYGRDTSKYFRSEFFISLFSIALWNSIPFIWVPLYKVITTLEFYIIKKFSDKQVSRILLNNYIEDLLDRVIILVHWFDHLLFIPFLSIFFVIMIDLYWAEFLNSIEEYKTSAEKFAEIYRIRWTDSLIGAILPLIIIVEVYERNHIFI